MKNTILLISLAFITLSCGYKRMGDLTMISNRNVDKSANYVLLARDVEQKIKTRKKDYLELAIDEAVQSVEGGEYIMNVKLYIKRNGKKIKIQGDVWGLAPQKK